MKKRRTKPKSGPISWGVDFDNSIPHSEGWECENPECLKPKWSFVGGEIEETYKQVVGFHSFSHSLSVVIIECPRCFSRFWVHFWLPTTQVIEKYCPNWPK